jgi:mannosyltransferase
MTASVDPGQRQRRAPDGAARQPSSQGSVPGAGNRPLAGGSRVPGLAAAVVSAIAELIIGGWHIGGPSLWRDEGYTLEVSQRPAAAILAMLAHQDAVHGLYYLLMHVLLAGRTSAVALRLPSLLATSLAAALTGSLGTRLARHAGYPAPALTGTLAGLLFACLPLTTWYAQDGRPYAMATAGAVAASGLLLRASESNARRWWAGYAIAVAVVGWLNLFALLLVTAHGISLRLGRSRPGQRTRALTDPVFVRWLAAAAAGCAAAVPLLILCAGQTAQLSWVPRPGPGALYALLVGFAGTSLLIPALAALAGLAAWRELGPDRQAGWAPAVLAVPWLVVPPVILLAVSVADPVYAQRYIVFCVPAGCLLVASGLTWLYRVMLATAGPGWLRRAPALPACLVLAAILAALTGPQLAARQTAQRPDNLREVAAIVAEYERPHDAVVYLPWDTRIVGLTYPAPFERLRDIGQARTPAASDSLRGTEVHMTVLTARIAASGRVWVVRWTGIPPASRWQASLQSRLLGMLRPIRTWIVGSVTVGLYQARPKSGE